MDSFDVCVFGSAIVDFISYVPRLPKPGETLHGNKLATGFGGKGANQCVAAAKLGAKVAFIGFLGTDSWGDKYIQNFQNENVDIKFVERTENENTGIAQICVSDNGENQIVIIPGANNCLSTENALKAKEHMNKAKVLICQLETPISGTIEALRNFKGVSILNAAPALRTTPSELITYPTILCVNETEAALMTNLTVETINDARDASNALTKMGAKSVIITLGERGVVYSMENKRETIHVEAIKVDKVVDTTGAGDAFIGALGYFLAKYPEMEIHQIIGCACYIASISVQHPGTQSSFPRQEDVIINFENTSYKWNKLD